MDPGALRSLPLSAADGFVLSRVDGVTSEHELASSIGLPEAAVATILEKLASLGAIGFAASAAPPPRPTRPEPAPVPAPPPAPVPAPPPAPQSPDGGPTLLEANDLPPEVQRRILELSAMADRVDHYTLLAVPRTADRKALSGAYFALAAVVHTDRYFRKDLGSFKGTMERLFVKVTLAYETLSDRARRAEYDATLPPVAPAPRPEPPPPPPAPRPPSPSIPPPAASAPTPGGAIGEPRRRVSLSWRFDAEAEAPRAPAPSSPNLPPPARAPVPPVAPSSPNLPPVVRPSVPPPARSSPSLPPPARPPMPPPAPSRPAFAAVAQPPVPPPVTSSGGLPPPARPSVAPAAVYRPTLSPPAKVSIPPGAGLGGKPRVATDIGRRVQAEKYLQLAEGAESDGDLTSAAAAYRIAQTFLSPDDPAYERARAVIAKADGAAGESYVRRAQVEETERRWDEAKNLWSRAAKLRPSDALAQDRTAHAILQCKGDLHEAERYAQAAVSLAPRSGDFRCTLARVYVAAGLALKARREVEAGLAATPQHAGLQALLKALGDRRG